MMKFYTILLFFITCIGVAQQQHSIKLEWEGVETIKYEKNHSVNFPKFKGKGFSLNKNATSILYSEVISQHSFIDANSISIKQMTTKVISEKELFQINKQALPSTINLQIENSIARDKNFSTLIFSPIIKEGNTYKKITSLVITYSYKENTYRNTTTTQQITQSVLATNDWYRFYVEKSGVYKISKTFLNSLGFNTNVDPRTIKIYGNGGRMLSLKNVSNYPTDLIENAIDFIGEEDGIFHDSDYILFYAEGVDVWSNESLTSKNLYADKSYYYVTSSSGQGKRISTATQPSATPSVTFTSYNNIQYHENDLVNIAKLGRRWFGEEFNVENNQSFNFDFPNLITTEPVTITLNVASNSLANSHFSVDVNNQNLTTISFQALATYGGFLAYETEFTDSFSSTTSSITVGLSFDNGGVPLGNGFLDFIKLEGKCNLQGYGNQFTFFNSNEATNVGVGEYVISNASEISKIWDVTDIYNATSLGENTQASFSFTTNLGTVKKYVAIDESDIYVPLKEDNASVQNQNLKGTIFLNEQGNFEDIDYLIITPQFLLPEAETLANFHKNYSQLNTKVVTLESIYLEFSSGKQDIAAIRNFIRYVYDNASSVDKKVKYVNLFGDASYDYKNRIANNTNIVPTFHGFDPDGTKVNNTANFSYLSSFISDDFFALMNNGEGEMLTISDGIDIAVGRIVAATSTEAKEMVNKIIEYHAIESYGRWRNNYVIYSDDPDNTPDSSLQFNLDALADNLTTEKPFINVTKIHTDAYIQEVATGGERYPEAKKDFINAIERGALVVNYYGHGNEEFLARERLFEKLDAQTLSNQYKYPLFIVITCEFTRFDDPGRPTGGEYMYWNNKGGAIALIATTRQITISTGNYINTLFSKELFAYNSTIYPSIGEALRLAKLQTGSSNRRVVFCIGDPALQLAIPKSKVVLTEVNDVPVNQTLPVFNALSPIKIKGQVVNENDQLLTNYNGDVAIQIFDKNINRSTLGNNYTSIGGSVVIMDFTTLGEVIFRGNASVTNGNFELNFIVPQDIRIPVGNGKISFYAKQTTPTLEDQTGYNLQIEIGGVNTNAPSDTTPPTTQLYMNDKSFVSGDITNCSPIFIAYLQDENGINTASGIGHDIIAILDGDESNPYVLNDYYETELDDFTKGFVRFPFKDLEPGIHTITFKVWDVYNNLTTTEIQFNAVCSSEGLEIQRVLNYPNPFVSYTEFWFTHNMPFEPLDVQVQILTISGKIVKTINQQVVTNGFLSREIKWDGKDDFGNKIGKGVYIYKITVKSTTTGKQTEKYEKLVIL